MSFSSRSSWFASRALRLALGLAALSAPGIRAAEPSPTELAVARRLFDDAVQLEQGGKWELAAAKLREAIAVKDTPGLRFHLAHCEEKLGLLVEALLDYRRAKDLIASGSKAPDVERLLGPAHDALEPKVPLLVVAGPADAKSVSFEIDGRVFDSAVVGRPAPMNPGAHRLVARAPGFQDFVVDFTLREGERRSVDVALQRAAEPAAPPSAAPSRAAPPVRAASAEASTGARTYVLVGESALVLAALGVGVGYWIARDAALDRARTAQEATRELSSEITACGADGGSGSAALRRRCAEMTDAVSDYHRARWISAGAFVTAGAGAVATALTYLLWSDAGDRPRVEAAASETGASLSVAAEF